MHDLTSKPFTDKANFPNPETNPRPENLDLPQDDKTYHICDEDFL